MKTILLILTLATAIAQARIGETVAACRERYGQPVGGAGNELRFQKNGFDIWITFFNDRAEEITYQKVSTGFLGRPDELSKNEIDALLKSNAAGVWKAPATFSIELDWQSADGSCLAGYSGFSHQLRITSAERIRRDGEEKKRQAAARKAEEDKKLNGL